MLLPISGWRESKKPKLDDGAVVYELHYTATDNDCIYGKGNRSHISHYEQMVQSSSPHSSTAFLWTKKLMKNVLNLNDTKPPPQPEWWRHHVSPSE